MDGHGHYLNNSVWMICSEDYFLLGVLNSTVGWHQISQTCTRVQNGYQLIWDYFKNIRIPDAPPDLRDQIAAISRRCLDAAKDDPDTLPALEAQLNALVYQAYGLDADDILVIEGHLGRQTNVNTGSVADGANDTDET
jgi:hypothetical protein